MMYLAIGAALFLILLELGTMVVPREGMDDQVVLYALSTLAQTCAALAAFVGAIGLFRLQSLRDGERDADQILRTAIAGTGISEPMAFSMPRAEVIRHAERILANQAPDVGASVPGT